jgi:hypothetical protein
MRNHRFQNKFVIPTGGIMGLRPTQGNEKLLQFGHRSPWKRHPPLCHPERTRISCHAALDKATYAPFRRERRMKIANATKFHRKSGGAQWRDLRLMRFVRLNQEE